MTTATVAAPSLLTITEVARLIGVAVYRVKYALDVHNIEPRQRAGVIRLWSVDDVPAIREAVEKCSRREGVNA